MLMCNKITNGNISASDSLTFLDVKKYQLLQDINIIFHTANTINRIVFILALIL